MIVSGKVTSIVVDNRGSDYTIATAEITGGGGSGATTQPILSLLRGDLRTFYYTTAGEKIILNAAAGTIEYDTGKITLTNFKPLSVAANPYYANAVVVINCEAESERIYPTRNTIITLDQNDSLVVQIKVKEADR